MAMNKIHNHSRISTLALSVSASILCSLSAACGAADPIEDSPSLEGDAAESAINGGTVAGGQGAVQMHIDSAKGRVSCTGVVISPNIGLTAAHCFGDALGSSLQGSVNMAVSYTENGSAWRCIAGGGSQPDGKCNDTIPMQVKRLTNRSGTPEYDFAVFVHSKGFTSFNHYRGLVIGPPKGFPYTMYGAGVRNNSGQGLGPMRRFNDQADWMGDRHFFTNAGGAHTCSGDSGGPYLWRSSNLYVMGIHSSSEKLGSNECAFTSAVWDGKQRANRIIGSHVKFINDFVDSVMGATPHYRCEHTRDSLYWCAPNPPPAPSCQSTCSNQCTRSIQSGTVVPPDAIKACIDQCVARCP